MRRYLLIFALTATACSTSAQKTTKDQPQEPPPRSTVAETQNDRKEAAEQARYEKRWRLAEHPVTEIGPDGFNRLSSQQPLGVRYASQAELEEERQAYQKEMKRQQDDWYEKNVTRHLKDGEARQPEFTIDEFLDKAVRPEE